MSTLYEHYNINDDSTHAFYGSSWAGQTFTPSITHTVTLIKLLLYRLGNPGTITVSIRETSGANPTGEDLCVGTVNGNGITENAAGEWVSFSLGAGYELTASTKYAIVVRVIDGDASNALRWRKDATSPTYSGGTFVYSTTSGVAWSNDARWDFMFEEWEVDSVTITGPRLLKEDGDLLLKEDGDAILLEFGQIDIDIDDNVAVADNLAKSTSLSKTDTVTISDSIVKTLSLIKTEILAITDSIVKTFGLVKAETVNISDSISKATSIVKSDTMAIADSIVKAFSLIKADTVTIADTLTKAVGLVKAETVAIADSISKTISLAKSESVAITDAISKAISLVKADIMPITETMSAIIAGVGLAIHLFDTVVITDSLEGVLWTKTYLKQGIARMQIKGMNIARMSIKRMGIDRMPLFRWIIRRWTA